jgi:outer membrane protein OmpA-like peptidoglycan-associated protein
MNFRTPLFASTAALALAACQPAPFDATDPNANARQGAIAAGMAGAVIGAATAGDDLRGAIAGGIIGATAGGLLGRSMDNQARELAAALDTPGVNVTNTGNSIVVNMPQDLLFATGSATLQPGLVADLRDVGNSLVRYPDSRVQVIGHTDNVGTAAFNIDLSQRRASSVASELIRAGVQSGRVSIIGAGFDRPVASNDTAEGRALNRRVEIIIIPTSTR